MTQEIKEYFLSQQKKKTILHLHKFTPANPANSLLLSQQWPIIWA